MLNILSTTLLTVEIQRLYTKRPASCLLKVCIIAHRKLSLIKADSAKLLAFCKTNAYQEQKREHLLKKNKDISSCVKHH